MDSLMRQPMDPCSLSDRHTRSRSAGVVAGIIVSSTIPLQCWHRNAHDDPVMEMDGKALTGAV